MVDGGGSGGGVDGEDEIASKAADGSVGVLDRRRGRRGRGRAGRGHGEAGGDGEQPLGRRG
eukprot:1751470-Prymnesium_polylepis.1